MAYTHSKMEYQLADKASVASAAVIGDEHVVGVIPHIVRAVSVVITTSPSDAGTITFKHRPTVGSSSGEVTIAAIDYAGTAAAGDVLYVDGLNVEVTPGESIIAEVTDATPTSGNASAVVYTEPRWERPENIAAMTDAS